VENIALMVLNLRKFFGFLVPGFAWVLLLSVLIEQPTKQLLALPILGDTVIRYAALLLVSYVIGSLNIEISFRVLDLVGDAIDRLVARIRTRWVRALFDWTSQHLHVFQLDTREHYLHKVFIASGLEGGGFPGESIWDKKEACKAHVIGKSPALARIVLEVEGDLNFLAGMFPPMLAFGIWLFPAHHLLGGILLASAAWFLLRFQHLRHHEIDVIARTYQVAQKVAMETNRTNAEGA